MAMLSTINVRTVVGFLPFGPIAQAIRIMVDTSVISPGMKPDTQIDDEITYLCNNNASSSGGTTASDPGAA